MMQNANKWKYLWPFVRKYLSAPCGSVESERLFSQAKLITRAGIFRTYAIFFLSFIRRETSKKHGFTLLRWLVFELSDAICPHFIRSMRKTHQSQSCGNDNFG
jgi:hypothetical protein